MRRKFSSHSLQLMIPLRQWLAGVLLLMALVHNAFAQSASPTPPAINSPQPKYPREWQEQGITGKGVAEVSVDTNGYVTAAHMLKSTGHKVLDDSALEAFRKWRFKPGTTPKVKIPIEFTTKSRQGTREHSIVSSSAVDAQGVRHRGSEYPPGDAPWLNDAVKIVQPDYSYRERSRYHQGSGLLRLTLDLKTGSVTKITVVKSTGFPALDQSAVYAFLRWRWKPGRWKEIDLPITFTLSRNRSGMSIGSTRVRQP